MRKPVVIDIFCITVLHFFPKPMKNNTNKFLVFYYSITINVLPKRQTNAIKLQSPTKADLDKLVCIMWESSFSLLSS